MESQNIFKLLLKLGLPMVISMLFNSLYNIVDSLFIAQLGDDALNAISLIYPMQNLITAVAVGFGVGISSTISYYFGAKIQSEMNNSASLGLLYSLIHSIILTIICLVGAQAFLSFFTDNTNVLNLGHEYAVVAFAFTIPNVLGITFEKIFQGIKDRIHTHFDTMKQFVETLPVEDKKIGFELAFKRIVYLSEIESEPIQNLHAIDSE